MSRRDPHDRRVHALCSECEVVRYDRAGKWYLEPTVGGRGRRQLSLVEAADFAVHCELLGGEVFPGLYGGAMFDRWVAIIRAKEEGQ